MQGPLTGHRGFLIWAPAAHKKKDAYSKATYKVLNDVGALISSGDAPDAYDFLS